MEHEHRRRIDRITSGDFLADLNDVDVDTIRAMRDDCREEEARLSFARRVIHGQLDIIRAEQRRRVGSRDEGLVSTLTDVLADKGTSQSRELRSAPLYIPEEGGYGQRSHDTLVDDADLGRVPDMDDAELGSLLERLTDKESRISSLRRTVLTNLDALQDELIVRYRDGNVDVDRVVASSVKAEDEQG